MKLFARTLDAPPPRGQSMVEFALILPVLALLLVLTIDVGRVFFGWVAVTNATRIGASEAANDPEPWAAGGTSADYYERITADLEAINCDADTNDDGVVDGGDLPAPTYIDRVKTTDPHEFGDQVKVALTCEFSLITPLANGLLGGGITVGAESTFPVIGATIDGIAVPPEPPTSACLPSERIVPNLIGMSVATARDKWDQVGFAGAFSPSDPTYDGHSVTAQVTTPAASAGSCLDFYSAMTVGHSEPVVCSGTQINVPNLIGLTLAVARTTWRDEAGFSGTFSPSAGDDDKVVRTQIVSPSSPEPGYCANADATVAVTYGEASDPPPPTCTAPQLVKSTSAQAKQDWTTGGFIGSFTTQPANRNNWIVKWQNLVGGYEYSCTASVIVYLERN